MKVLDLLILTLPAKWLQNLLCTILGPFLFLRASFELPTELCHNAHRLTTIVLLMR